MPRSCFIDLDRATGGFGVRVGGSAAPWLAGAPIRFHANGQWRSTADGTLKLLGSSESVGSDAMGEFNATVLSWRGGGLAFETGFYQYASSCLFETHYPDGVANASVGFGPQLLSSAFPSFELAGARSAAAGTRGYYLWQGGGVPGNPPTGAHGSWPPTAVPATQCAAVYQPSSCSLSGVLSVFDEDMSNSIVVSAASQYVATGVQFGATLDFGLQGMAEAVPKGFRLSAIVHAERGGVNAAMRSWGHTLLARSGKPRDGYTHDRSLSMLGYTTDNGAYYYYNTIQGSCYTAKDKCVGYEETFHALKSHLATARIPVRWALLDSWFYAKATTTGHAFDPGNGVTNWTDALPEIFPSGLRALYEATGWFVVAHNRAWATSNVYDTRNGGQYAFLNGRDELSNRSWALPLHQRFWDDLFDNASKWGLANYQQDWMYTQAAQRQLLTDPALARTWTLQMDAALVRRGMHFGFGGVTMGDWLQSVEMRSASNGRISADYHADLDAHRADANWKIGLASIFAWALSLAPAKDGWWSSARQPGHPYPDNRTEPFASLHAAVATLSRGPVTPADGLGYFNRSLIMRTCMEDGTLLQPDAPATALDAQLRQLAFGRGGPRGEVWSTRTLVGGVAYQQLLVAQLEASYALDTVAEWPAASEGGPPRPMVVVSNAAGGPVATALPLGRTLPLSPCGRADFELLLASPVLANGWAVLGELGKFVPVSAARFAAIRAVGDSVEVELRGVPKEVVQLSFARRARGELEARVPLPVVSVACVVPESGRARARATAGGAACLAS